MIILCGLAGTGKSTHGQILAEDHEMVWLSVGQVLRDTGEFEETLKRGELVDDDVVIRLMSEKIRQIRGEGKEIVLDGFPRDKYQAEWVAQNMAGDISKAVLIDVPKEELWRRIEERGRADDTKEAIERRFEIVEQNIYAILEILKQAGVKIETISGVGGVDEVSERLEEAFFGGEEWLESLINVKTGV